MDKKFNYPAPDNPLGQMQAAVDQLLEVNNAANWLTNNNMPVQATEARLRQLTAFATQMGELAVSVAMHGVAEETISQAKAARLLDVHPATVTRWTKIARAGEPVTGRPKRFKPQQ